MILSMTYYAKLLLAFFLLSESASPIRTFPVNVTNHCDRRAECQVAINDANLYILNVLRDADEKYDWKNNVVYDNWIRKIKKRHVVDFENVFSKTSDQKEEIYKLLFSCVILHKHT